jgi:flagellin-specific chaperone FliS
VSNFTQYVKSLVVFGEERQQEIRWLFDALDNSLMIAQKNATVQRSSSAASSLRHAKNLLSFLNRCFSDLPDKQLVTHLEDFFAMLDRAVDQSIQLPLEEDLEEIRELIAELQKGWETLLMPSTSVPKEDDRSHLMSIA